MARETINKGAYERSCWSTLSWTSYETPYGQTYWRNTSNTTGSNTIDNVDFSAIPSDAEIISATYSSSITAEILPGQGWQTLRKANGDYYADANSANLKRWFVAGGRKVNLLYSYRPDTQPDQVGSPGRTSAWRTYKVSMSVVYEAGNKTWLLHYGSGDEWKPVVARGGEDGEWKLVEAYYGQNGTWTKLEKIDVGD